MTGRIDASCKKTADAKHEKLYLPAFPSLRCPQCSLKEHHEEHKAEQETDIKDKAKKLQQEVLSEIKDKE